MDELIDHMVALFTFIIDKDLYIEVYRNHLARRLLQDRSEDMEAEKQMITNLKISCGLAQIKMLEGMIADLMMAKGEIKEYEETNAFKNNVFEFQVQCLTTANWPTYKQFKIPMPPVISQHMASFMQFYNNKHQRRTLTLCFSLGQAVVQMSLPGAKRPTDLVVSTIAMFILLMFNDKDSYTVTEVAQTLQLEIETVRKNLSSLTQAKYRILNIAKQAMTLGDLSIINNGG